jgi:NADPH:quinone reductase-like Zn-dependent oxidoreductase
MKAIVCHKYGPPEVLQLKELEKPRPKDSEVLIKVYSTTVTSGDSRVRSLRVPKGFALIMRLLLGISKPRQPVLGSELAGVVEAVGSNVTNFNQGDTVFAFSDMGMGCHAEYKCMPASGRVLRKPATLSFDEAAALSFGGVTALDYLRRANVRPGDQLLVNGASGCVGTAVVQLARHFGAEITGVCSEPNHALVTALGADHVIDYRTADFTQNGKTYDVIVDAVGNLSFSRVKHALTDTGRLLLMVADLPDMLKALWTSIASQQKIIVGPASVRLEDLHFLASLAEKGQFRPVIDRCYPLDQCVDAHRYVDSGRKKGSVCLVLSRALSY